MSAKYAFYASAVLEHVTLGVETLDQKSRGLGYDSRNLSRVKAFGKL